MAIVKRWLRSASAAILGLISTLVDIILFVLSLKVFPLAWHVRNYYSFVFRYLFDNRPIPPSTFPTITLFQPTIWTSSTPLGELDIMGHKSNATYFTDFDAARSYHLCSLFRTGLKAWSSQGLSFINPRGRGEQGSEPFYPAVGGVACTFRKAIRARQKYDIVTQVLSWDEKWVYFVSYFVKKGSFNPVHFSDQPNRKGPGRGDPRLPHHQPSSPRPDSTVLAIAVGKVVFKKGRKTIPPAQFLRDCGHLPSDDSTSVHAMPASKEDDGTQSNERQASTAIEERRVRGLRVAQSINGLEDGLSFFDPGLPTAYSKF